MPKHALLREFLTTGGGGTVTLTFGQIGQMAGALPPSARTYQRWWLSNDPSHQHCQPGG